MMKMLAALGRVVGLLPLAVLAALVTGCQTVQTTQGGVVGVEREQRMMVSGTGEMRAHRTRSTHGRDNCLFAEVPR